MKFCQPHWDQLKAALTKRGLDQFFAADGKHLCEKLGAELSSGETKDTFEPLMGAHNAIVSNAMQQYGLAVMAPNEDGSDRCPLCMRAEHWIECASDDQLKRAIELGLVQQS